MPRPPAQRRRPRGAVRLILRPNRRGPGRPARLGLVCGLLWALGGCVGGAGPAPAVAPAQAMAQAGLAERLPAADAAPAAAADWRALLRSPRLRAWAEAALHHNRELRQAWLQVQQAQAQLALADASRRPSLGLGLGLARDTDPLSSTASMASANARLASWEIDLSGRLARLGEAAQAQLLASQAGRRAAELALVAAVAQAGLALQADDELAALAGQQVASRAQSLALMQRRVALGAATQLDLQAQRTLSAQARAGLAQIERQRGLDANALALLVGRALPDAEPGPGPGPVLADEAWVDEAPGGLSSAQLLRRPDVLAAEQGLRAAQGDVAAARAAFWPTINLTAQAGLASAQLTGLLSAGGLVYASAASFALTVFDGGRHAASVEIADLKRQQAQLAYERSLQAAFRDTADALAGLAAWRAQVVAQRELRDAARETARLVELKSQQGAATALERLDAERGWWAAEQALVQARLGELGNRVALLKALGA